MPWPRNDNAARDHAVKTFGWFAAFIDDPELGPKLLEGGANSWTEAQFIAAIQGTNWWRQRSDAQREYEKLLAVDPAGLQRVRLEREAKVRDIAANMGFRGQIDEKAIADYSLKYGWSDQQIQDFFAMSIGMEQATSPGDTSNVFQRVKNLAADYFIKLGDNQALDFAKRVAAGELDEESLKGYFAQQAKSNYSYLAEEIDKGITVREYFMPVQAAIAATLEQPPEGIDLMNDFRWSPVLRKTGDDGKERAMNMSEAQHYARNRKEWTTTSNARQEMSDLGATVARIFGRR